MYRLHERLVNLRSEYNLRLKSGVTVTQIPMTQIHTAQVLQQAPMRVRPELDEVTMRYIHDLLGWVEENQRRVDDGEWGSDLPTVESQLGSHRGLHQSVEEFRSKIERAKADEVHTADMEQIFYIERSTWLLAVASCFVIFYPFVFSPSFFNLPPVCFRVCVGFYRL